MIYYTLVPSGLIFLGGADGFFGGLQLASSTLGGFSYSSNSFANYVVEGFGGFHDFLNDGLFYYSNGTSHPFALGGMAGEITSALNVGLAMPVDIPALIPVSARSTILNGLRKWRDSYD